MSQEQWLRRCEWESINCAKQSASSLGGDGDEGSGLASLFFTIKEAFINALNRQTYKVALIDPS